MKRRVFMSYSWKWKNVIVREWDQLLGEFLVIINPAIQKYERNYFFYTIRNLLILNHNT